MTVIESLERSLQELPEDERDQLGTTFVRVVQLLEQRLSHSPRTSVACGSNG